jgi:uncharacterized protein YutE (UPF0331/DUF86 family)
MVKPEKVKNLLGRLSAYVTKLEIIARFSPQEFQANFMHVESAKHLLQVSIECCLDISHHIIASERFRTPGTYVESLEILVEENIIPRENLNTLRQMVRFRNRLVHLYWDIEEAELYEILQNHLGDFDVFARAIIDFMHEQGHIDL